MPKQLSLHRVLAGSLEWVRIIEADHQQRFDYTAEPFAPNASTLREKARQTVTQLRRMEPTWQNRRDADDITSDLRQYEKALQ